MTGSPDISRSKVISSDNEIFGEFGINSGGDKIFIY